MSKHYYCAQCGMELFVLRKALPQQQRIVELVEPHSCNVLDKKTINDDIENNTDEKEVVHIVNAKPPNLDALFAKFEFSKKLGNENKKIVDKSKNTPNIQANIGDSRPKSQLRNELKSTAPSSILSHIRDQPVSGGDHSSIDEVESEN